MARFRYSICSIAFLCSLVTGFADGYRKDGEQWVYSWRGPDSEHAAPVTGADGRSFRILEVKEYAADKNAVYWRGGKIPGALPASFKQIHEQYWADAVSVYCYAEKIPGADPKSFTPLPMKSFGPIPWSKDKNSCFHGITQIPGADPETFTGINYAWARDGQHYYVLPVKEVIVVKCDYDSMTILTVNYAKDKNRVYFQDQEIAGADVPSFRVLGNVTAMDNARTYMAKDAVVFVSRPSVLPLGPVLEKLGAPARRSTNDGMDTMRWESAGEKIEVLSEDNFIRVLTIEVADRKGPVTENEVLMRVSALFPGWQWIAVKGSDQSREGSYKLFETPDKRAYCNMVTFGKPVEGFGYSVIVKDSTINMPKHWQDEPTPSH